jgi:riboflavin kinase/FMN adenylyltransferase
LLIPPDGVYAGWTRDRPAAISVGTNPQFDGVERRVEAHLLDFDDDLYDQRLVVEIWTWLRGQMRFESVEALVEQIGADVDRARDSARPV